ncbi:hypothetical protein NK553_24995 [Pseudomonas sp. ZM23]|uniref:Uncharacterized protein n=1 Tax=Pseudomonas triclosanedens TaxID=2961893 RepID=A0ABY6ZSK8_9PSED|nr:hypothetical protein [Pseudomonas triclosanedens]MCP8467217.1 hypothetical protein [Pseudomonas triclosanedens]MCP8472544.1 hypothetical protein [Pseudomonas triclosanedens]MCP8478605.1 hypothetical protein [Pseudomonas triclosanedens]WAI47781.1 hypothetical protein OU419_18615 [Pseudomonas triclosanedens]
MDKARKQRLLGVLALVLLFGGYVAWTERPQIVLRYEAQGGPAVSYSFRENGEETLAGEIKPGEARTFPLRLWRSGDYRVAFQFHRGAEKYASFSSRPGYSKMELFIGPNLEVSTQPRPEGLIQAQ